jgi:adenine-specific DNA-methyltransferase
MFAAHIRKLKEVIERHKARPAAMVGTVLYAWCAQEYPWLTQAELPVRNRLLAEAHVKQFLSMLRKQPFLEAAYCLSSAYALLRGDSYRKSLAMFFTPPPLTERLLCDLEMHGVQFDKNSFFDPACGGAAFLAPIALRMRASLKAQGASSKIILQHIETKLSGTDLDGTLCALSRQFLKMALCEEIREARREPSFRVSTGNSLRDLEALYGTIDVLVCNPPYRKTTPREVKSYRRNFGEVIEAQPNMYGLFIALSIKLLKQTGICALVTPTSFLSGQYFSKLRGFLMKEAQVLSIGIVGDRSGVFIDVLQETALTFLRRTTCSHASQTEASVSVVSRDGKYVNVGPCVLPNSGASWPIPRAETDVFLLRKAAASKFRLKDYGYALRIGAFVWNRDERPVYMSAAEVKRRKAKTAVPLLWSSDIKSGGILRFDGMKKANGEPCFVNLGDKAHRSIVRRASVLLQRVTSNDQSRRLVAAVIPQELFGNYGGFVGENHTVILEQVAGRPTLTPRQMAALLSTQIIDRCFRCISGATNVSVFELSQLPLPDPVQLKRFLVSGRSVEEAARMSVYGHSDGPVNALHESVGCA